MTASDTRFAARSAIEKRLHRIVAETMSPDDHAALEPDGVPFGDAFARTIADLEEDLSAFAVSDPAAGGSREVIFRAYSSFDAIVHYRLAHVVLTLAHGRPALRRVLARRIADRGKVRSGVDIHPAAVIGRRFILDHAYGTVIGETCQIGSDCYVLGGVTLGARGIARNANGKRHPTIGDRVQIGAFAKVLGPVRVGDDVFISPNSVITGDVPPGARVTIVNQMQMQHASTPSRRAIKVYGVGFVDRALFVLGAGLSNPSATIIDDEFVPVPGVALGVTLVDHKLMRIQLDGARLERPEDARLHIRLCDGDAEVVLIDPRGLRELLEAQSSPARTQRPGSDRAEC